MSENSTSRTVVYFLLFLLIIIAFLGLSLGFMIVFYYSGSLFSKVILATAILFIGFIAFIIIETFIKKNIIAQSRFPICHDMIEEFGICARCRGFYAGFVLFGILLAIKNSIYLDLLRAIGVYPYFIVMFLVLISVPVHGALRRLSIIKSNRLILHLVGFIFGSAIYLIGSYIVYIFYGV